MLQKLKFIGTDGSMGLKHGKVYYVCMFPRGNYIVVQWTNNKCCPYSSFETLYQNWEVVPHE